MPLRVSVLAPAERELELLLLLRELEVPELERLLVALLLLGADAADEVRVVLVVPEVRTRVVVVLAAG